MRNYFLVFILLYCFVGCEKTNSKKWENKSEIKDSIVEDVLKKSSLFPDSAIQQVRHFQSIDSLASDSDFYYRLQQVMGQSMFYLGKLDSSLYFFSDCYNYWKKDSSQYGLVNQAKMAYNMGYTYEILENKQKALKLYNQVLSFEETPNIYMTQVTTCLSKSKILMDEDKYDEAMEAVEKSITLSSKYRDSTLMISALQAYADVYTNCGFFDEASQMYKEVLKYKTYFTPLSQFLHHNNKGRMYFLQDKFENAKQEFLIADSLAKTLSSYDQYVAKMNISEVLLMQNNTKLAKEFISSLQKNIQTYEKIPLFLFYYNSLMGEYSGQIGNYAQANHFFQNADSVLAKNEMDNVLKKMHFRRESNFYFNTGNYKQAFNELKKFNEVNKNILQNDNRRQVSALKYKYQRDTTLIAQQNALRIQDEQLIIYKSRQLSLALVVVSLLLNIIDYFASRVSNVLVFPQKETA